MDRTIRPFATALLAWAVAGCSAMPPDQGRGAVVAALEARGLPAAVLADSPAALPSPLRLAGPLTLDAALQRALVANPALRGHLAELGFAAADVYDAGRLSNPRLGVGYFFPERGDADDEISIGLTQNFTELLLLATRRSLAEADFERVRLAVAAAVQRLAEDVARAWIDLAGTTEVAALQAKVAETARLAADLGERYQAAGNLPRDDLAELRTVATEARLAALQAGLEAATARAKLARLLGATLPEDGAAITAGLPPPAGTPPPRDALLTRADQGRLDLAAARQAVAVQAQALGITRRFRYLGAIDVGARWERDDEGLQSVGPRIELEVPIFNRGAGRIARAEAELARAEADLAAVEAGILAEVERGSAALDTAHARYLAYRDQLLPLRGEIVARRQEQVNFMLEGPFVLLDARAEEFRTAAGLLDAARGYWLASIDLASAVGSPPTLPEAGDWLTAAALGAAKRDARPHVHHHGDHP
jgi:cobalt-zinc-cadmium efflux system outer membrane protein